MMENMSNEIEYLLKGAGVLDPLRVMQRVRKSTIRRVEKKKSRPYIDYWKSVPADVIEQVRFIYRYEIGLFGYPLTPFVL